MVRNLQRLGIILGREDYKTQAIQMLLAMREATERYPSSFSRWTSAMLNEVYGIHEIAIVGENAAAITKAINRIYLPNKVQMSTEADLEGYPLTAGKGVEADTNIFICKNYTCQMPVKTIEAFKEMLDIKQL